MHARSVVVASISVLAAVAFAGCTGTPTPGTVAPSVAASVATTAALTATPAGTPTVAPDAPPAELQGEWTARLSGGEEVGLRIGVTSYAVIRYGTARNGHVSVTGQVLEFSRAAGCAGSGTYVWAINAGKLPFTPTGEPDPCPRYEVLKGVTYARAG